MAEIATSKSSPGASRVPAAGRSPSYETLQRLVDRAASFDLYVAPETGGVSPVPGGGASGVAGFRGRETLRRFQIRLHPPHAGGRVGASNRVGEEVGHVELRWLVVPDDFVARPGREPPATGLEPTRSQRIVLQETTLRFGGGGDGFRCFGSGRTFPTRSAGEPRLVFAAVGDLAEGLGRLDGFLGNFTLCGELSPEGGFTGHVMMRVVDPEGALRTAGEVPPPGPGVPQAPGATYLTWVAQKGHGTNQENRFSLDPSGAPRGLNIPVQIDEVAVGFHLGGPAGLEATGMRVGEAVGLEIGFGREVRPRTPDSGTPLTPYQFEGVSEYLFHGPGGEVAGSLTANFLEGRSFRMVLPDAPEAPALRFGYFGPIVGAKGCFEGATGMIYGAAGSVFAPPPADHVITNVYVARLDDPDGRFRVDPNGGES